jgi:DNA-binding transcriptional regulator YhcF (GntR family)
MRIPIDPNRRPPVWEQLRDGIARRITSGRLAPGERVPAVRELAAELGLAPNTVAKAYRALETSGHLVGRGRLGTFVTDAPPAQPDAGTSLDAAAEAFAARVRVLGASRERALSSVRRALHRRSP